MDRRFQLAGETYRLTPRTSGRCSLEKMLFGIFPLKAPDLMDLRLQNISGKDLMIVPDDHGPVILGEKVEPSPLGPDWRKRAGTYEVVNLGSDLPLFEKRTRLTIESGMR